jgi:hypothetical protein
MSAALVVGRPGTRAAGVDEAPPAAGCAGVVEPRAVAVCEAAGGLLISGLELSSAQNLAVVGEAYSRFLGLPAPVVMPWECQPGLVGGGRPAFASGGGPAGAAADRVGRVCLSHGGVIGVTVDDPGGLGAEGAGQAPVPGPPSAVRVGLLG